MGRVVFEKQRPQSEIWGRLPTSRPKPDSSGAACSRGIHPPVDVIIPAPQFEILSQSQVADTDVQNCRQWRGYG